jgi:hypothetical protein
MPSAEIVDRAQSKWVNEEILAFKRLGREDRILCIIVGGEPNASELPGREAEECFPPALRWAARAGRQHRVRGTGRLIFRAFACRTAARPRHANPAAH